MLGIFLIGDDGGMSLCLADESKHLCMSGFSKDDDRGTFRGLFLLGFILPLDAPLQLQNHRACGINNLDVVVLCELIGLGGLSMGSQ